MDPRVERRRRRGGAAAGLGREVAASARMQRVSAGKYVVTKCAGRQAVTFTGILRDISGERGRRKRCSKAGGAQSAIFNSANFSSIATDAKGSSRFSTSARNACSAMRPPT